MEIKRYHSSKRMSKIVVHGDTVYLCGQVPKDESVGIALQTKSTLERVDELLAEVGSSREKILTATVYIKNMSDFKEMNEVWDEWIPEGFAPARACVEANMARETLLFEVSVIAAL